MLREFINKYKINYVAKILGLTPQAIRYYEKKRVDFAGANRGKPISKL